LRLGGRNIELVESFSTEFLGFTRLMIGLGFGFLGIIFLVIAVLPIFKGYSESEPTEISVETVENEGFPDQKYLLITGANVVFSRAQIALVEDKTEFDFISAPAISGSLWSAWKESQGSGEALNAESVRLLVRFERDDLVDLWAQTKEQGDQSHDLFTLRMDVVGWSRPMQETWVNRGQFSYLNDTIDWDQLRVLDFQRSDPRYWDFAKRMALAVGFAAISILLLFYRRPVKRKLKVGDTYRFSRE
jgi:hypothetical protein